MDSWNSGYVSDINYTHGFYRELTPALLELVTLIKGDRGPDIAAPLAVCELGCGQGFSANLLAAANPHIQFHATDFNPSQVAGAKLLAADADLGNVHFYDRSFAALADARELPESFDFIVLHGIYSWISAENRAVIVDFIQRKLKVGGLVYISYNALPGWAAAMPLRRLLVDHAAAGQGPIASRINDALGFAEQMKAANARYFPSNPTVGERFDRMKSHNRSYLAHEYFNRDWTPFYAADVFEELSQAKLTFVGAASLLEQVDAINLTADQQQVLAQVGDTSRRETIKDFMLNQQFRRDVFQKGSVGYSASAAREAWLNKRFALSVSRNHFDMTIKGALGEAELSAEVYTPLLDAFAGGPKTLREALGNQTLDAGGWMRILQAITILVGAGRLEPCLPAKDENKRARSTRSFNQAVIARARDSADLSALASPVTGGGIVVPRFEQLFLLAIQEGRKSPAEWADYVWNIFSSQGQAVRKEGTVLQTVEDNVAELRRLAEEFAEKKLPVLKSLQVV